MIIRSSPTGSNLFFVTKIFCCQRCHYGQFCINYEKLDCCVLSFTITQSMSVKHIQLKNRLCWILVTLTAITVWQVIRDTVVFNLNRILLPLVFCTLTMRVTEEYSFSYICNEKHSLRNKQKVGKSEISWLGNQSTYGMKGWIQDFPHSGIYPKEGRQPIIWPNLPKKCITIKRRESSSKICLFRSSTGMDLGFLTTFKENRT